ncbi:(2Fe-2S) ferredoxin domain-containing protein [Bradyrhizobium roseum]|uniref:(2Fe-2S) ferredoxin domain-containing protein n=1 Tax=Bradyrhizobium roseum TaxID=3056648 RepID=UPI00261C8B94|nr:(2Fe-2S) ferredoxin domain-containing protein [Bradyrhizobium roseus]WKA28543.1 (2Fe-2S) ferredoxin domain-containing protein [Bradyrhizobium roseus]
MTDTADIADASSFELPQVYKHHVFACHTQRPPGHPRGSCGAVGAQPLWDRLGKLIEKEGLAEVGFTASGCLGFCKAGPLMVIYPEGVWYRPANPEDIDEIVEQHFKQGRRVDRLVMVLTRR